MAENHAGTKMPNRNKNVAICGTTIFPIGGFLDEYRRNILKFGHEKNVRVYIAGDNRSPATSEDEAAEVSRQGLRTAFLTIKAQHDYLKAYPEVDEMVPENSDNRRNVAYLMALEEGADVVISIDDDNFPTEDVDFVGEHLCVGEEVTLPEAIGHNGWYNLCDLLLPRMPDLYPRGFPYRFRHENASAVREPAGGRLGMNVGLWTNDPDSDAIARLYCKPRIDRADGRQVLLGNRVRCPINTQNTALSREAMAAYYYLRMGENLRGLRIDRFGDIFSGYFVQVCAEAVGDRIRIGSPVADHRRNSHNLLLDLYHELAGIMIIEDLAPFLATVELPGESYTEAYRALSTKIEEFADEQDGFIWLPETKQYFHTIAKYMRVWADVTSSMLPTEATAAGATR